MCYYVLGRLPDLPYNYNLRQHYASITKPPIMPKAMPAYCADLYYCTMSCELLNNTRYPLRMQSWAIEHNN